jgi:hypothetical protein
MATPTIIINEVPPKNIAQDVEHIRLTTIAGNTAIRARNKDPGKVIKDITFQDNLKFQPGLIPGIKPPLLFKIRHLISRNVIAV